MIHSKIAIAIAIAFTSTAAISASLGEITERALARNPDVRARLHEFLSASQDQEAGRGALMPRIDVEAYYGRERLDQPGASAQNFNHPGASIQLRQILFDGGATRSEIRRLSHTKITRYYELLSGTDDVALEVARAYLDVLRYRQLTRLAQDNWLVHKEIYDQIEQRVVAGVGRRVDLEQAAGRLALAQSNWLTETSNLHDVSARFERVVGEAPPVLADPPEVVRHLPQEKEVLDVAIRENPNFQAAISNLRAARAQTDVRRAANSPTVELRASHSLERNRQGVDGVYSNSVGQIVFNYNLFRGGADDARFRSAQEQYNVAVAMRDRACRDIRQNTVVAWNENRKLREQLPQLEQHALSTEKARDAYRQQFDIGQRSLLDVLDTENELFEARRALARAQYDLKLAEFRVLTSTHRLLPTLGLSSNTADRPREVETEADPTGRCSTTMPEFVPLDLRAAMAQQSASRPLPPLPSIATAPLTPPAPRQVAPLPPAVNPAAPAAARPPVAAASAAQAQVIDTVRLWAAAWSARDLPAYMNFYSDDFEPLTAGSRDNWRALRAQRLAKPVINVSVENVRVERLNDTTYEATFVQRYKSSNFSDMVRKTLTLKREGDAWRIIKERAPLKGTN